MSAKVFPTAPNSAPINELQAGDGSTFKLNDPKLVDDANIPYADDQALYQQRIDKASRLVYWQKLYAQDRARKMTPSGFQSWVQIETASEGEIQNYPATLVRIAKFFVSSMWDQWYLNMILIFLVLLVLQQYSFITKHVQLDSFVLIPLFVMIFLQAVPLLGTIIMMIHCNDLMQELAVRSLGDWVSDINISYFFAYGLFFV
jgi:hypothetical protein